MSDLKRTAITKADVSKLAQMLGRMQALILDLGNVDLTRGKTSFKNADGSLEAWLWTKKGQRITVSLSHHGVIASLGKDADAEIPEPLTTPKSPAPSADEVGKPFGAKHKDCDCIDCRPHTN